MSKLLRVLIIILLLLSGVALFLGIKLFGQRVKIKGRVQKLEKNVIALGTTIEAESAEKIETLDYPERDISECTAEIIDNPEHSDFWKDYSAELEKQGLPTVIINKKKLKTYYNLDPVTGKKVPDPETGEFTKGKNTMQAVLENLLVKAEQQYNRLNETRQQLKTIREELVTTIENLNKNKKELRSSLNEIVNLKKTIDDLKTQIQPLKDKIEDLEDEKQTLGDQITQQQNDIALLQEQIIEKDSKIESLKKELSLQTPADKNQAQGTSMQFRRNSQELTHGEKGKVVSVNSEWNFVIIELSDDFMHELLGDDLSGRAPTVELFIKRPGQQDKFITKAVLIQVRKDKKLGVANILTDWQQLPVEVNDVVFY